MALQLVSQLIKAARDLIKLNKKAIKFICLGIALSITLTFIAGKTYQSWDDDPQRGAVAIENGEFNESYSTPVYLDQGWSASDSLWYYNTTQGSALLPYDFYLTLEQKGSETLVRDNMNMDKYRYLPQKPTFFNPDGLAVGFVKETYLGKDYMGYTCAACHTSQVNYQGTGIRIDGGPAMTDMVGFLTSLEATMKQTLSDNDKREHFIKNVLALKNDYKNEEQVIADLEKWTEITQLYNTINHSKVKYGHARLDAFGRIYNRVLQYVLSKENVEDALASVTTPSGRHILSQTEVNKVLEGVNETILGNADFSLIIERLMSKEPGYPGLSIKETLYVRNALFNEPNAPVSYPFLWDIAQSDYVQWNGLAGNSGLGPLGRNTGEVLGVFGILDWTASDSGFSLSSWLTGQDHKRKHIDFKSSIDIVNLQRLEAHLKSLQSPQWHEEILGTIEQGKVVRGQRIYAKYCQSCHEVIDRSNLDRKVVAQMSGLEHINTDPAMAENSGNYSAPLMILQG